MLETLGKRAKDASRILMTASTTQKNAALSAIVIVIAVVVNLIASAFLKRR